MSEAYLQLPCIIGSLMSLRPDHRDIFVRLLIPHQGTVAWVPKSHLTIVRQSATEEDLRGLLRSKIIVEDQNTYMVEIKDRERWRGLAIPKDWLERCGREEEDRIDLEDAEEALKNYVPGEGLALTLEEEKQMIEGYQEVAGPVEFCLSCGTALGIKGEEDE